MIIVQCSNVIDQGHKCQNKCIGPTRSSAWQTHCKLFLPLLAFGLIGQNKSGYGNLTPPHTLNTVMIIQI